MHEIILMVPLPLSYTFPQDITYYPSYGYVSVATKNVNSIKLSKINDDESWAPPGIIMITWNTPDHFYDTNSSSRGIALAVDTIYRQFSRWLLRSCAVLFFPFCVAHSFVELSFATHVYKVASALHCWVLGWWSIALYVIQYIMMRETLNLIRKWSSATLLFLLIVLLFICIQRVSVIVHNIWRTAAVAINSRNIISWGHWH